MIPPASERPGSRAAALLQPLRLAIEELHSRREDNLNNFGREEAAVGRVLRCLEAILRGHTHEPESCWNFLRTAAQTLPDTNAAQEALRKVATRRFEPLEKFRYWLVVALSVPLGLHDALRAMLPMQDVVGAFYTDQSLLLDPDFLDSLLPLLPLLYAHPSSGSISYNLDATALGLFEDATTFSTGLAARAEVPARPRRRPVDASGHPAPRRRPRAATVADVHSDPVGVAAVGCQTDEAAPAPPAAPAGPRVEVSDAAVGTEDPAPQVTFAELLDLERVAKERARLNDSVTARLRRREQELEEQREEHALQLEQLGAVLANTKTLYNELSAAADYNRGRRLDPASVNELLPHLMHLLRTGGSPDGARRHARRDSGTSGATSGRGASPARAHSAVSEHAPALDGPSKAGPLQAPQATLRASYSSDDATPEPSGRASAASTEPAPPQCALGPAPPDTPPSSVLGDRPWCLVDNGERERQQQLTLQRHRCPECGGALPQQGGGGFLMKAVHKAGQVASKPRRCHYSAALYCHKCHTNKTAVLPFKVAAQWDFTEYHVSDPDHAFLQANADRPLLHLPSLPEALRERPCIRHAASLRRRLVRLYRVLTVCPEGAAALAVQLRTYYFTREHFWSLTDMLGLRAGEGGVGFKLGAVPFIGQQAPTDVTALLEAMLDKAQAHVKGCKRCGPRCVGRCVCGDSIPVRLYEEDGECCGRCGTLYHIGCYDVLGCTKCS